MNFQFQLRDYKKQNGTQAVRLRFFTSSKDIQYLDTGVSVLKTQWDEKKQQVKKNTLEEQLNASLNALLNEVKMLYYKNEGVSAKRLLQIYRNSKKYDSSSVLDFYQSIIDETAIKEAIRTAKTYQHYLDKLRTFSSYLSFTDISPLWAKDYELWLMKRGNKPNTIASNFKCLNAILNKAVKLGIIEEFTEKYFHKMRGEKIYFSSENFIENNKLVSIVANPDTVVAYGVGIAVGMKERNKMFKERILTDVCPFTLGTELVGKRFAPIIPRNTTVPTSKSEYFYTIDDYQDKVNVGIYQGESLNIDDNLFLGNFLIDVPRNIAGKEAINVRFTYDINGILEVEATVVSTGLKKSKLIVNGDLSEEEKNEKIKMLEEIKIQSENKNKDKLLLERANRIYAEIVNTEIRNHISDYLENYQMVVATGDRIRIQKTKESFSQFLDKIDPEINDMNIEDILKDFEDEMEEEDMKEEDELEFWN